MTRGRDVGTLALCTVAISLALARGVLSATLAPVEDVSQADEGEGNAASQNSGVLDISAQDSDSQLHYQLTNDAAAVPPQQETLSGFESFIDGLGRLSAALRNPDYRWEDESHVPDATGSAEGGTDPTFKSDVQKLFAFAGNMKRLSDDLQRRYPNEVLSPSEEEKHIVNTEGDGGMEGGGGSGSVEVPEPTSSSLRSALLAALNELSHLFGQNFQQQDGGDGGSVSDEEEEDGSQALVEALEALAQAHASYIAATGDADASKINITYVVHVPHAGNASNINITHVAHFPDAAPDASHTINLKHVAHFPDAAPDASHIINLTHVAHFPDAAPDASHTINITHVAHFPDAAPKASHIINITQVSHFHNAAPGASDTRHQLPLSWEENQSGFLRVVAQLKSLLGYEDAGAGDTQPPAVSESSLPPPTTASTTTAAAITRRVESKYIYPPCEPPFEEIAYRMCILQEMTLRLSWSDAGEYCRKRGAELAKDGVVIKTRRVLNDLYGEEGTRVRWPVWVGARSSGSAWEWEGAAEVANFMWAPSEPRRYTGRQAPKGTCMILDGYRRFYGASLPCHLRRRFVCQRID